MISKITKSIERFRHWMSYQPPGALSSRGWKSFNSEFKQKAPIRWWFHRDFRHKFTLPIKWKYEKITDYIRYRTYDRYHILKTGLVPAYYDTDTRMLHANFTLLVEFVEVEKSWSSYCWADDKESLVKNVWMYKYLPFARHFFREPVLGIKHLDWEATLDDPALPPHEQSVDQAVSAREIKVLYKWWAEDRPNRKEIPFISLRSVLGDDTDIFDHDIDYNSEEYKRYEQNADERNEQTINWDEEDTEMLLRLIKIRKNLWT